MNLKPIEEALIPFAFECMKELRGEVHYSYEVFYEYINKNFLENHQNNYSIFIAYNKSLPIGILTYNKFLIPRYLGFGYELEEVIIDKNHQNKGYGTKVIELFFKYIKEKDSYKDLRKVIVKTDDKLIASKLYQKLFSETDSIVYAKQVNYL